ncbi:MAG: chromosome segregation protein SMC [Candidatus Rokubacteria bacterium]|nr:chromosome segregation protein SMC [Candidatus Rokubacteria bacterium]
MRLLSVALFGFKSFVDRTEVKVLPGITAIVGPNGCGKTNIADALRWALGEQSPKALRGQRMEDVIFHGSTSRRPLGLAEVLLTFSNDGDVAVPWSEVSVGRRLYRDGESEYLLNKTACRLKDVHDLFLGTGVNPKAYALMEQERLAHILTARPLDRRLFVEEAAGITRYKQQRAETLGKLEATRQNLLRVRDVMDEVKRQLASLERQAKKAKQYKALQAERRTLELVLLAGEYVRLVEEEGTLAEQEAATSQRAELLETRAAAGGAEQEVVRAETMAAEHRAADLRHARDRAELELEGALGRAEQLRQAEQEVAAELARLTEEAAALTGRLAAFGEERVTKQGLLDHLRREFAALRARAAAEEATLDEIRGRLRLAREEGERLRREQVVLAGRRTELGQALGGREERRGQLGRRLERLEGEQREAEAERDRLAAGRWSAETRLAEATARAQRLHRAQAALATRIEAATAARGAAVEATEGCRVTLAGQRSSLAALEELEAQRAGYGRGVQAVFAAAREARLDGVVGTVADLLEVPRDLERAVEAALGERLQWVVVQSFSTAKRALEMLCHGGSHGGGQATFLPLDWLNGGPKVHVPEDAGVLGGAGSLVGSAYPALLQNLLGAVVVVRDLGAAERCFRQNGNGTSFVTVGGEVVAPPGAVGGGRAAGGGDTSLLARKRAIRDLQAAVADGERALQAAVGRMRAAEAELAALGAEHKAVAAEREGAEVERLGEAKDLERLGQEVERAAAFAETLRGERAQLAVEAAEVAARLEEQRAELAGIEATAREAEAAVGRLLGAIEADAAAETERAQAFLQAQVDLAALAGRIAAAESELNRLAADEADTRARLAAGEARARTLEERAREGGVERARLEARAAEIVRERDEAQAAAQAAADALQELTDRLRVLGEEARATEAELSRVGHTLRELTVRSAEVRVRRQDVEADARRQFEVLPDALRAAHDPERDREATRARIDDLAARIAALEPVNLIADDEYRELDERLGFLRTQHDDLTASVKDLERALRGMTRTAHERFNEAFEAINKNFQELFVRLFEGGRAELRLVEAPEGGDPLETGIDMVAQPRGKRLQAISLLSGGEKALTGLALLFAIFYYRPSPFCLLDEVDAPLDDANIHRFTRVLRELSGHTQFIVITHNRKTMEAADVLYGVTMEEPGVSRLVSVSLT